MHRKKIKVILLASLVFILGLISRWLIIDNEYKYSFESDSEPAVECVRSFYFFFKSPSVSTFPTKLTAYPNYSDGSFICSALLANAIRPLCQMGIIKQHLFEKDRSLFIFSMRWSGIIFNTAAITVLFLTLYSLSQCVVSSFAITILFYLFNPFSLNINNIRIDHYILFTANLCTLGAILVYKNPNKMVYYLLCGVAAGLTSATKINFPFYLTPLIIILGLLIYQQKIRLKQLLLFSGVFFLVTAFMYQRWIMYYEEIPIVVLNTLKTGGEWAEYWGNGNFDFYHREAFHSNGFSYKKDLTLWVVFIAITICIYQEIKSGNKLLAVIICVFILQSVVLIFSPKNYRYGLVIPQWYSVFLAIGYCFLKNIFNEKPKRIIVLVLFISLLLPGFIGFASTFKKHYQDCVNRSVSLSETRLSAKDWILKNIPLGSQIAIQHPRVSNPPIFQHPYRIDEKILYNTFLNKEDFLKNTPPSIEQLNSSTNYLILNNKEIAQRNDIFKLYNAPEDLVQEWNNFYKNLNLFFPCKEFNSKHENYGINSFKIYEINKYSQSVLPKISHCNTIKGKTIAFCWNVENWKESFDIQIAVDSSFRWLVSGSYNGFPSRYRKASEPRCVIKSSFAPPKILSSLLNAEIVNGANKNSRQDLEDEIQQFFKMALIEMADKNYTLEEVCVKQLGEIEGKQIIAMISDIYEGNCPFLSVQVEEYIKLSGLSITLTELKQKRYSYSRFIFFPKIKLQKGQKYYWRVRIKDCFNVLSSWSDVSSFSI